MLRGSLVEIAFRRQLTYRAATMAGMITNLFWGFLRSYVFQAVNEASSSGAVAGYTTAQLFTYSALTQALIAVLMVFGWWDLMNTIKTGDVVTDMCKPVSLFWFWQARDIGRCLHDTLLRGVPLFVLYALFMPVVLPPGILYWLAFTVSLVLAYFISFSWRFLVNCIAFRSLDARGFGSIAYMVSMLLMGFVVPVGWFPAWMKSAVAWTPFPSMLSTPADIFLGYMPLSHVPVALMQQAAWLLGMVLVTHLALALGIRKLVIQGG